MGSVKRAGQDIEKSVSSLGKNVERNLQNTTQGIGLMLQGNFNNADRTILDLAMAAKTGGASLLINPDDVSRNYKESAVERVKREGVAKAAENERIALETLTEEQLRARRTTISGLVDARRASPGRSSMIGSGSGDSLLTYI